MLSTLRNVKWGGVVALLLAAGAIFVATTGASDLTIALSAASITFAILTERS